MKRPFIFVVLTSLLFFSSAAVFSQKNSAIAGDMLEEVNHYRKAKGLKELEQLDELDAIAQKHSEDMASGRIKLGHTGFAKRNAMASSKVSISYFAENVAFGAVNGKQAVDFWKRSSGHRRNMLGNFKYTGIGIARNKQGRLFFTQVFGG